MKLSKIEILNSITTPKVKDIARDILRGATKEFLEKRYSVAWVTIANNKINEFKTKNVKKVSNIIADKTEILKDYNYAPNKRKITDKFIELIIKSGVLTGNFIGLSGPNPLFEKALYEKVKTFTKMYAYENNSQHNKEKDNFQNLYSTIVKECLFYITACNGDIYEQIKMMGNDTASHLNFDYCGTLISKKHTIKECIETAFIKNIVVVKGLASITVSRRLKGGETLNRLVKLIEDSSKLGNGNYKLVDYLEYTDSKTKQGGHMLTAIFERVL